MAAKCAVDGALHDLLGKICGQPLWRILGLDRTPPPTSYTISIDTLEGTADRARRAAAYRALKIKVGGPGDLERVRIVREAAPDALIRVDANEAWTVESTRELVPELVALGVELVEQPLPAADRDGYAELHAAGLPIPIVLDESCHTLPDVAPRRGHGRRRSTSSSPSRAASARRVRMIHAARALELRDHARVHERVEPRHRRRRPDLAARRRRRPRRPPAERQRHPHRASASWTAASSPATGRAWASTRWSRGREALRDPRRGGVRRGGEDRHRRACATPSRRRSP